MFTKKAVVILVVIAIVLAGFSIVFNVTNQGQNISTINTGESVDSGSGNLGITVGSQPIEDKGAQG